MEWGKSDPIFGPRSREVSALDPAGANCEHWKHSKCVASRGGVPHLDFTMTSKFDPRFFLPLSCLVLGLCGCADDGEDSDPTGGPAEAKVDFVNDIKPILQRSCVQCHSVSGLQEAELALDDEVVVKNIENIYNRIADDEDGGHMPLLHLRAGITHTSLRRNLDKRPATDDFLQRSMGHEHLLSL